MKIEVWFDFACPVSFVGNELLKLAIDCFGEDKSIEIEYKSYQLEPHSPIELNENVMDLLQRKSQSSFEKRQVLEKELIEQAKHVGLMFDLERICYTNTYDAHRLVKFAEKNQKEKEIIDLLHDTFFHKQKNIAEKSILLSIAREAGLDEAEAEMVLAFNKYEKAIKEDRDMAVEVGIDHIPFLIFNDMYAISGVQPLSIYIDVLQDILQKDPACYQAKDESKRRTYCIGSTCDQE